MTTIKDIAKLSGYSIGTVSRVLNNHPDVSEEARIRIESIIEEQNFAPNSNAKHLKQQKSSAVTIIVKGYQNLFFEEMLEEVQANLREAQENAVVTYLDEDDDEVTTALQLTHTKKPKGFIFLGANLELFREEFNEIDVPCVVLTNTVKGLGFDNISSFTTDDEYAGYTVINELIKKGHKRIGIIGGDDSPEGSQVSYRRLCGCYRAFREHGIPFDRTKQYVPSRYDFQGGYDAMKRLLEKSSDITAVFGLCDTVAIGAMRAINDLGMKVPDDISIVGFDGIKFGKFTNPRLNTVRQDTKILAKKGVADLLLRLKYTHSVNYEEIPFHIIERESVKDLTK